MHRALSAEEAGVGWGVHKPTEEAAPRRKPRAVAREYRCGKCGFLPKRAKHNCQEELKRTGNTKDEQSRQHQLLLLQPHRVQQRLHAEAAPGQKRVSKRKVVQNSRTHPGQELGSPPLYAASAGLDDVFFEDIEQKFGSRSPGNPAIPLPLSPGMPSIITDEVDESAFPRKMASQLGSDQPQNKVGAPAAYDASVGTGSSGHNIAEKYFGFDREIMASSGNQSFDAGDPAAERQRMFAVDGSYKESILEMKVKPRNRLFQLVQLTPEEKARFTKERARWYSKRYSHVKVCSTAECGAAAKVRGLCMKHGAYGFCSFGGCSTAALSVAKGTCSKHGARRSRKVCTTEGCTTFARARGVCTKHGAFGPCQVDGCTTNAISVGSPCCYTHGGGKEGALALLQQHEHRCHVHGSIPSG